MNEEKPLFAEIIMPLAIPRRYTYQIPTDLASQAAIGQRCLVQFGKRRIYTGIIAALHHQPPAAYQPKHVLEIVDSTPVVTEKQISFWHWVATYYMCTEGEVMIAAIPAGLRLESETRITRSHGDIDTGALTDQEYLLWEALSTASSITIREAEEITGLKTVWKLIQDLVSRGVLSTTETVREKYRPLEETVISLSAEADEEANLEGIFGKLEKKAPRQLEVLMRFVSLSQRYQEKKNSVRKADLVSGDAQAEAAIRSLVKKGIFVQEKRTVSRIGTVSSDHVVSQLSPKQELALSEILKGIEEKKPVLLHGITGSGKTLLYERLISDCLQQGKHALYLLPEIALTTQIIDRMASAFPEQILVYHSKVSDAERVEIWQKLRQKKNRPALIIGPRSALFLPFEPGLIIVDEEHDPSYKQHDPAPRYQARDVAVMMASGTGAGIVLGSATPSVESYFNAHRQKYVLVSLEERYGDAVLPKVEVVDIKTASRKKLMQSHFSPQLMAEINTTLASERQVILFQNRRGYVPVLQCDTCGWIPHCVNCDVALTLHRRENKVICHYCGFRQNPVPACEACGSPGMKMRGFGTEKIEEELQLILPEVRIARMDLDSTRGKLAFRQLVDDFSNRKTDILVGTQMLTKGFDFSNVGLVGILNADSLLHFPDFRAYERAFQLMVQVSGRAGRSSAPGKVIIQTWQPDHPVINHVVEHDYKAMINQELMERQRFGYPPYMKLIRLTLRHRDEQLVEEGARVLGKSLRELFEKQVLGPDIPYVSRIRNEYLRNFLVKINKDQLPGARKQLLILLHAFRSSENGKKIKIVTDVDP